MATKKTTSRRPAAKKSAASKPKTAARSKAASKPRAKVAAKAAKPKAAAKNASAPKRVTTAKTAATKKAPAKKAVAKKAVAKTVAKTVAKKAVAKTTPRKLAAKPKAPAKDNSVKAKVKAALSKRAAAAKAAAKPVRKTTAKAAPKATKAKAKSKAKAPAPEPEVILPRKKLKSPYNKAQLRPLRKALHERLVRVMADMNLMSDEALKAADPDTDAESVADHGSDAYERNLTLGLMEHDSRTLRQIETALVLLDEGVYGLCNECEESIPIARLEALPFATTCVPCQEKQEGLL